MDETQPGYEIWSDKFKRKFKENPWVPIGCLATTGALFMASVRMRHGKSQDMQYWLRARVLFQGVTVVALLAGTVAFQAQGNRPVTDSGLVGAESSTVANTEPLRGEKREKEKAEFEARLKDAEVAHAQEQAFLSHTPPSSLAAASAPTADKQQNMEQTTSPASGDSKGKSSWRRWLWGSGDSNKS
ncbi:hypothetical protein AGABI1DRAFT_131827 [Agaricus bisporus var. burnettii JB137-S8]|uniref:HIG1 domain-containing protein n=1 Tax=Agaricus bisporus var. burnettii (strain JB137-S8 / ATCC MYA-4627 / FGSC 10392) TaxID=597362 RepID=K5VN93_AGABU|nr:uncharacterized protein AGABI1DRAFT_131827 [Agaricus bisporus var. burnettii JB137-S8]EKM75929.1 hypothetical protein AGABI1DRAFT_131827 [Agaricus bisporus var. burnettii JB137-S8]